ncbi:Phage tail protein [Lentzea xinjiangensis]|uniref:Phage tail protein n=1 Tax=Lentzea xinjiangensis TaxID=402600 RepID=A0A1H9TD26_9PSEU|nr:phage tail domain-containing protein [Lentzea xinjiangensis]SER95016.1 Phage tail protein [Lentzea xinjiangensis]
MSRQITWIPAEVHGLPPIVLTDAAAGYEVHKGVRGLGAVPRELVTDESPWADGAVVEADFAVPKQPMLPMAVRAPDRDTFLARLRALEAAVRTRTPAGQPAPGQLELQQADGRKRRLWCYYLGGLPDEETIEFGGDTTWQRFGLQLLAADPYWYDAEPTRLAWDPPAPVSFLGDPFLPLKISPSQVIGDVPVTNGGTEATYGTWRITPPGTDLILRNDTTGEQLQITETIPAAHTLVIKTEPGRQDIRLFDDADPDDPGVDWWEHLADGAALWALPAGTSQLSLTLSGASAGSKIELEFYQRWSSPW